MTVEAGLIMNIWVATRRAPKEESLGDPEGLLEKMPLEQSLDG